MVWRQSQQRVGSLHEDLVCIQVDRHHAPPFVWALLLDRRAAWEHTCVQYQHIQAAELAYGARQRRMNALGVRDVASDAQEVRAHMHRRDRRIDVQSNHCGSVSEQSFHARPSDTGRAAGDERDFSGERGRFPGQFELGLFELPVLDIENVPGAQGPVAAQGMGPQYDLDGVFVDLGGDRCVFGASSRRTQSELGIEDDTRRGIQ